VYLDRLVRTPISLRHRTEVSGRGRAAGDEIDVEFGSDLSDVTTRRMGTEAGWGMILCISDWFQGRRVASCGRQGVDVEPLTLAIVR
jgi:hypothetical protein